MFENRPKSNIQKLRAKRATITFWVEKSWLKRPKMVNFDEFLNTWILWSDSVTRQKLVENAKIQMRHLELFSNNVIWTEKPKWTFF